MIQGPVVAVMLLVTCHACSSCVNEYVAPYKDLKTCWERIDAIKRKHPGTGEVRYCRLDGVVQEIDYDK